MLWEFTFKGYFQKSLGWSQYAGNVHYFHLIPIKLYYQVIEVRAYPKLGVHSEGPAVGNWGFVIYSSGTLDEDRFGIMEANRASATEGGSLLFSAVSSSARQLFQLLRCISFASKAQVRISKDGLRFTVEEFQVMQGQSGALDEGHKLTECRSCFP